MLARIKERKLVQWVIAYTAGAFIVVQGLDVIAQAFPAWTVVLRTALVLAFTGLPIVLVIGWFHGEKGRQRVSVPETLLLAGIVVVSGFVTYLVDPYDGGPEEGLAAAGLQPVELEPTRLAVMPFLKGASVPDSINEAVRIHDALSRWQGIEVVDHLRVRELVAGEGGNERRLAANLGAGRYVAGSATVIGSTVRLSMALFDTGRGERLAEASATVPRGGTLSDTAAARLAHELLFPTTWSPFEEPDVPGTTSYPAERALQAGLEALDRWDLSAADSLLGEALRADPDYSRAHLLRAQVRAWDGRDPAELLGMVDKAVAEPGGLNERERLLAEGLLHLGREEYVEACAVYDSLRRRDDRDFGAWFGLGECRARDDVVVRDPESPSGWAFRGSYRQAVLAYRRAFELLPTVFRGVSSRTFERVGTLLRVSAGDFWSGRALPPDTAHFLARPALLDDTLAFVPHPAADVIARLPGTRPATFRAAVERQRRLYNDIAEHWADAFPRSREALASLAHTREMIADPRALETLDEAIALTEDSHRRLLMRAERVNLLVKFGSAERFADARALADSVLGSAEPSTADEFRRLAVTAALVGRPTLAARWAARGAEPQDWVVPLPVAVTSPAAALSVYAAFGGPADSIRAYEGGLEAALRNRIPLEQRESARAMLLVRAASLAYISHSLQSFADLATQRTYRYPLLAAEYAHTNGDRSEALRILADNRDNRRQNDIPPAEVSYDALFPEAWLWTELGDTATAIVMLGGTLDTRRWSEPGSLSDAVRAASLVRAMALRAELAAATDDRSTAERWAKAVIALWGDTEPVLEPVTERMQEILAPPDEPPSEAGPSGSQTALSSSLPKGGSP